MRDTAMPGRSINQIVGGVLGAGYLLVGLAGFAVTGGVDFAGTDGDPLFGVFELNPLHNVVHLAIGLALGIGALGGPLASRTMNLVVGGSYLLVGLAGLFVLDEPANVLALNGADNALHIGTALVLLGVSVAGTAGTAVADPRATTARTRTAAGSRRR